jgi:hypothetical protein
MIFATGILVFQLLAVPIEPNKHKLELVRRNGIALPFYYPESTSHKVYIRIYFQFSGIPLLEPKRLSDKQYASTAISAISNKYKIREEELFVANQYTDSAGFTHVYMDRM